jgi:(2Fe-2S) ferredoxin
MPGLRFHIFVCTNRRPADDPRGCCADKGSEAVLAAFKRELAARGLTADGAVRANASGCLNTCARGVSVVVYPEGVWYGRVRVEDVPEIVTQHVAGGVPVARLRMP